MKDFTLIQNGLFTNIVPNNAAAEECWRELHKEGNHVILSMHLDVLKAALKAAGYTYVTKKASDRPKLTKSDLEVLKELEAA